MCVHVYAGTGERVGHQQPRERPGIFVAEFTGVFVREVCNKSRTSIHTRCRKSGCVYLYITLCVLARESYLIGRETG